MSKKSKVVWSPSAIHHFSSWVHYIAKDSLKAAEKERSLILKAAARLESFPLSGRVVPELGNPNLREVICSSIRLIYEIQDKAVRILAFHHAKRRLDLMLFG